MATQCAQLFSKPVPICRVLRSKFLLFLYLFLVGCASQSIDPFEGVNRGVSAVNHTADRFVLRPIAVGYEAVLPEPVELGVSNVFSNLADPWIATNQLLQGKPDLSLQDFGRFLINSTIGVVGLFDVASHMGLEKHNEDFGQTLAVWGVESGPYIVVPFWGPTTLRDGAGSLLDSLAYVPRYIDHVPTRNVTIAVDLISRRAKLLDSEGLLTGDKYLFFRDAYLQQREYLINDGVVEDSFLDDE